MRALNGATSLSPNARENYGGILYLDLNKIPKTVPKTDNTARIATL